MRLVCRFRQPGEPPDLTSRNLFPLFPGSRVFPREPGGGSMPDQRGTLTPEMTEDEALERCRRGEDGDHAGFRVLYERHRPEIERFLARLLGDRHQVEDALQDTFVRLHRALKGHERGRPLRPYVFAIARN